jgi:hypothetical protein
MERVDSTPASIDAYTLTKESILKKREKMMKEDPELCERLQRVGNEAKEEMEIEFDMIEIYVIMTLLETRLIDVEDHNARVFMHLLHDCTVSASTGDSHDIEVNVRYYMDCFEKRVRVC